MVLRVSLWIGHWHIFMEGHLIYTYSTFNENNVLNKYAHNSFSVFQPRIKIKELSLCHKLISSHPCIFAIDGVNLWYSKLTLTDNLGIIVWNI